MSERFELPPELTIYTASATTKALVSWLAEQNRNSHDDLEVAGHAVQDIDGAGLQLLAALHKTCMGKGLNWQLTEPSDALLRACRTFGKAAPFCQAAGAGS